MGNLIEDPSAGLAIDDDDRLYEVIDGIRVEKPMGATEVAIANWIAFAINQFTVPRRLGFAYLEVLLDFGQADTPQFRPDLIFLSNALVPMSKRRIPRTNAWAVVPELAVEVVSDSNSAKEIHGKVERYLKAGVKLVWIVYPESATVHVCDGSSTIRIVRTGGILDGGPVIPGFELPLANLFEDEAEQG